MRRTGAYRERSALLHPARPNCVFDEGIYVDVVTERPCFYLRINLTPAAGTAFRTAPDAGVEEKTTVARA